MSSSTNSTVDQKEDEKNKENTNEENNWSGFKSELISGLTTIVTISILGSLFLLHTGGNLYLTKEKLNNIKKNNETLWEDIMKVKSEKMEGINIEKTPYTSVGSNPEEEAFFSLKNYAFPYRNFFNKHKEWKFNDKEPNFKTAKPVLYTCGSQLEKTFSGSWSTGRYMYEAIRKICNGQAEKAKKYESFGIPIMLFWGFGIIMGLFMKYGIWLYAGFSVIVFSLIYLVFHIIDIFNIPDPPVPKEKEAPSKVEPPPPMDPVTAAAKASADAASETAFNMTPFGQAKKAGFGAAMSSIGSSISYCFTMIKDGIVMMFAALIWFLKRAMKSAALGAFTYLITMIAFMTNGIIQPVMFIGWFLTPLFDTASRKIIFEYINRQRGPIALILYILLVKSCYNNLHEYHPEYIAIAGLLVLIGVFAGYVK
jgi:hypothetical protein